MPSTLSSRRVNHEEYDGYVFGSHARDPISKVNLPQFSAHAHTSGRNNVMPRSQHLALTSASGRPGYLSEHPAYPHVVPSTVPTPKTRRAPILIRANRALRTVLVALCGIAILGYGLDVAASNDAGRLQEQARRLNEQNSELSSQLLKAISFQGIQDNALGHFGLSVPEQVIIVKEVPPVALSKFNPNKHPYPIMSGY